MLVSIDRIEVRYNPRSEFDLPKEFLASIKSMGLIQPLCVAKNGGKPEKFILLDGERRFRACKKLGLKEVDVFVKDYDEQEQKFVPIMTDLMKNLLPMGDKAVAIHNLVNKEKKYTVESIAKALGLKLAQAKRLDKVGGLHPRIIEELNAGQIDDFQAEGLAKIVSEGLQLTLLKSMAKGQSLANSLEESGKAFLVDFNDTMLYERIKKDRALGVILKSTWGEEYCYCFDKAIFDEHKKAYEEKEKQQYAKQEKKNKVGEYAKQEQEIEEKKKKKGQYKKQKEKQVQLIADYKIAIEQYLKGKPTKKDIDKIADRQLNRVKMDSNRAILKAFGVQFKVADTGSDQLKKMVSGILLPTVKTEKDLLRLTTFVDIVEHTVINLWHPEWLREVIKKLNG